MQPTASNKRKGDIYLRPAILANLFLYGMSIFLLCNYEE